jgi:hypothetical protein
MLARHRNSWQEQERPYDPLEQAYTTRMIGPGESHFYLCTIFLDGTTVTFATMVAKHQPDPDLDTTMDEASQFFDWAEDGQLDMLAWRLSDN